MNDRTRPSKRIPHGKSLLRQLLLALLIPLIVVVIFHAWFVYNNALKAADLAYDRSLLVTARALAERVSLHDGHLIVDVPYLALDSFETDTLGRLYFRVKGLQGEFVAGYEDLPDIPINEPRSSIYPALVHFYNAKYHAESLRIAALHQPIYDEKVSGVALIQVAETSEARHALSRKILIDTLIGQTALIVLVALLVTAALILALRSLRQYSEKITLRDSSDLTDLDDAQVHREVQPLVRAINVYIARLRDVFTLQRRFIADASHQLRTPLTSLKIQSEFALRSSDAEQWLSSLKSIAQTTDQTIHLANRLLTLARAQQVKHEMTTINITEIAQQVCVEFAPKAVKGQRDMSFDGRDTVIICGHALLIHEMLSNLIDNALTYTTVGGNVHVEIETESSGDSVLIHVRDDGIGIPKAERMKVLEPFYRIPTAAGFQPGTGLGMSIVNEIVKLHEGSLELLDNVSSTNPDGQSTRGLWVKIRLKCITESVPAN